MTKKCLFNKTKKNEENKKISMFRRYQNLPKISFAPSSYSMIVSKNISSPQFPVCVVSARYATSDHGQNPNIYRTQQLWLNAKLPEFKGNTNRQAFFVACLLGFLVVKFFILTDDVNYPGASAW